MTFGENPKKVRNIVDGNFDAFQKLYSNKIKVTLLSNKHSLPPFCHLAISVSNLVCAFNYQNSPFVTRSITDNSVLVANTLDQRVQQTLLESMPANVLQRMRKSKSFDVTMTDRAATKKHVRRAVASIVNRYSRTQSIKGIATAGAVKTVQYVAQKLQRTYFKK